MKFGLVTFPTDYSIAVPELARAAEEHGFESLFVTEHTHIPASANPLTSSGQPLPEHYWHTLDPMVGLTAAAMVTTRLLVGTGVCLVVEHDPIVLAKSVASLDHLSGGRFLFGVGAGWNAQEMADHGTAFDRRWKVLRERVEAMKAIWTEAEAEYHGEFVNFGPIWSWPKPLTKPHPPVLIGSDGPGALKRVARYGDGWFPRYGLSGAVLGERMRELDELAAEAGRDRLPVTVYGVKPEAAVVEELDRLGVDRAVFTLPSEARDPVLRLVERYSALVC